MSNHFPLEAKVTWYNWQIYHNFYKGDNFCNILFVFLHTKFVLKGVYSKKKEFCYQRGANSFYSE